VVHSFRAFDPDNRSGSVPRGQTRPPTCNGILLPVSLPADAEVDCRSPKTKSSEWNAHLCPRRVLQSRTGVGTNCKSAFPEQGFKADDALPAFLASL
jgi:hypothetical protein